MQHCATSFSRNLFSINISVIWTLHKTREESIKLEFCFTFNAYSFPVVVSCAAKTNPYPPLRKAIKASEEVHCFTLWGPIHIYTYKLTVNKTKLRFSAETQTLTIDMPINFGNRLIIYQKGVNNISRKTTHPRRVHVVFLASAGQVQQIAQQNHSLYHHQSLSQKNSSAFLFW